MRLTDNEIPGWTADTISLPGGWLVIADEAALRLEINGGYVTYAEHGWIDGAKQQMEAVNANYQSGVSDSLFKYSAFIFNFGTSDSATAMYNAMYAYYTVDLGEIPYPVQGYDSTIAFGKFMLGGAMVIAHHKNLYFEQSALGFSTPEEAIQKATLFLNKYFDKAN